MRPVAVAILRLEPPEPTKEPTKEPTNPRVLAIGGMSAKLRQSYADASVPGRHHIAVVGPRLAHPPEPTEGTGVRETP